MPLAGDIIEAGRVPGWRIATEVILADSGTWTTTPTQFASITNVPLVNGRTYEVILDVAIELTVDGVVRVQSYEDVMGGTTLQIRDFVLDNSGSAAAIKSSFEYTASATGNKTFVFSGDVLVGGGTANLNAAANFPSYIYVNYLSG